MAVVSTVESTVASTVASTVVPTVVPTVEVEVEVEVVQIRQPVQMVATTQAMEQSKITRAL